MKLRIPSIVQTEVRKAAEYYEKQGAGLGNGFWSEVDAHIRWIRANAEVPRLRSGDYRRVNLRAFPYFIAYAIRSKTIVLLGVAHTARKPEYWKEREG